MKRATIFFLSVFVLPIVSICVVVFTAELLLRSFYKEQYWPGYAFFDGVEILHKVGDPGVNSLGFFDKLRTFEKPDNVFRILLLGDSFVDGQKVDFYLEQALSRAVPDKKFEVIPMGISGTGTLSQLAFYEKIGRKFSPDMVLVLFVPNDFTNNSNILESIRLRFHPFIPGRNFATKVCNEGTCSIEPVVADAQFEKYILKELPSHPQQSIFRLFEKNLNQVFSSSRVFDYIKNTAYHLDTESLYHRFDGEFSYRINQLQCMLGGTEKISGWNFPEDLDIDAMFLAKGNDLPLVFNEALEYTTYALEKFNAYSFQEKFDFLVIFSDSCTYFPQSWITDWEKSAGKGHREIDTARFMERLLSVVDAAGVGYYDLYPSFAKRGDITKAHLPNDNHWSDFGQKIAGDDIAAYIVERIRK